MWFKNIRAYRLTSPFSMDPEQLGDKLSVRAFVPCASSQSFSMGWVPPLGAESEALVHAAGGRLLLKVKREDKLLPATVVRQQLEEKIADIEAQQARKVYRKERLGLKDEIVQDCLPRAFSRSSFIHAYIDTAANWIFIDTVSAARAEEVLNLLRECIGTFPVLLPQVNNAPLASMTNWLAGRSVPGDFELGSECELREPGEEGGIVRCRGVDLLSEEVETHLHAGKQVARLALQWDERVALLLGEDLCLRRLKFAEELMKENEEIPEADQAARLDADFALMSDAVTSLQERIVAVFGGEAQ
ncbi:MAG: recombination-associated protein RdgC [Halioglobus sp.]|nr:recombination-associated protein RdgC [Halioglobus sp.]